MNKMFCYLILAGIFFSILGLIFLGEPAFNLALLILIQVLPLILIPIFVGVLINLNFAKNKQIIYTLICSVIFYGCLIFLNKGILYSGEYENEFWVEYYFWKLKKIDSANVEAFEKYKYLLKKQAECSDIECQLNVSDKLKQINAIP